MPASKKDPYEPFDDPDFGRLELKDEAWEIQFTPPGFEKPIALRIVADHGDIEPSDSQRKTFKNFISTDKFKPALEAAMWKYYQDIVVKNYRPQMSIREAAETTPDLQSPQEIWPLVNLYQIDLEPNEPSTVHLWAGAKWDEEHGMDFDLINGKYAED